jgi:predicted enzyme related to lactoylglutathione lyase
MKKGDIVHFEINAKDPQRAKKFYSKVFGWKFKDSEIPGIEYYVVDGVTPGGAVNPMQHEPGVVVYFGTDNIDQTLKDIRDGGGQVEPKQAIQGMGWFAPCVDPEGNKISLFQNDPSVTAETERQTARV